MAAPVAAPAPDEAVAAPDTEPSADEPVAAPEPVPQPAPLADVPAGPTAEEQAGATDSPLAPGWEEVEADDGRIYYWNEETDSTTWDKPSASRTPMDTSRTSAAVRCLACRPQPPDPSLPTPACRPQPADPSLPTPACRARESRRVARPLACDGAMGQERPAVQPLPCAKPSAQSGLSLSAPCAPRLPRRRLRTCRRRRRRRWSPSQTPRAAPRSLSGSAPSRAAAPTSRRRRPPRGPSAARPTRRR